MCLGERYELRADALSTVGAVDGKRAKPARARVQLPTANGTDKLPVPPGRHDFPSRDRLDRFGHRSPSYASVPHPLLCQHIGAVHQVADPRHEDTILRGSRGKQRDLGHLATLSRPAEGKISGESAGEIQH